MILVDTSVWIDFFRGMDSPQRRLLHKLLDDEMEIGTAEIIITEVLQGVRDDKIFSTIREYLMAFPIYTPMGVETYVKAACIYRLCRSKGKTVRKTVDCIIAAICLENDLPLLHKDSDFESIAQCTRLKVV